MSSQNRIWTTGLKRSWTWMCIVCTINLNIYMELVHYLSSYIYIYHDIWYNIYDCVMHYDVKSGLLPVTVSTFFVFLFFFAIDKERLHMVANIGLFSCTKRLSLAKALFTEENLPGVLSWKKPRQGCWACRCWDPKRKMRSDALVPLDYGILQV